MTILGVGEDSDVSRYCRVFIIKYKLECGPMPNVMAALPSIGDALCESSIIQFLVPHRKVWLTPTARVPCSNAGNTEHKTWTQSEFAPGKLPLRGNIPRQCSNEAKKRTVEICWGAPDFNRSQPLVRRSSPYCEDLLEILAFNKFFSDCR